MMVYITSEAGEMLWLLEYNQYNHLVKPRECFESIGLGISDLNSIFILEQFVYCVDRSSTSLVLTLLIVQMKSISLS